MEDLSYMELYICQQYAAEAIQYYEEEYHHTPLNASDAEEAVWECYHNGWFTGRESEEYIERYIGVIVDQIGFMVEGIIIHD